MSKNKKIPMRMCAACRARKPKSELIRVVKNNNSEIFIDKKGNADGRGAYICLNDECLKLLKKKRGLERSFKCKIDSIVYDDLKKELKKLE